MTIITHDKDGKAYILVQCVNDNARSAFTRGQCHALALAANEQYDYPIYLIGDRRGWRHVLVRVSETHFGDIHGLHTEPELVKHWDRWSNTHLKQITAEQMHELVAEHADNPFYGFEPPDMTASRYMIECVHEMWSNLDFGDQATTMASSAAVI